jgi:putative transposase
MARKLRLEYPGACYHVINRGNYRAEVFRTEGAKAAFEACVFAACEKSHWVLHAFVVMRNHYHLALETPEGNLVTGLQWLQSTYANRFNKLRGERGHLFQGRYKALLVEKDGALGPVCHYLHLNPVRAGVVSVERLGEYRHSSYWYLARPESRPPFLDLAPALADAGGLADTPAGRRRYAEYLDWQATEGPAGRGKAYVRLSAGWALGTREFQAALLRDHAVAADARVWASDGARELRVAQWEEALASALRRIGRTREQAASDRKTAAWKMAVAAWMKRRTQVSNGWLSERLALGAPAAFSRNLTAYRRLLQPTDPQWKRLTSIPAA